MDFCQQNSDIVTQSLIRSKSGSSSIRPRLSLVQVLPTQLLLPPQPAHHLADHAGEVVVHLVHLVRLLKLISFLPIAKMHSLDSVRHSLLAAVVGLNCVFVFLPPSLCDPFRCTFVTWFQSQFPLQPFAKIWLTELWNLKFGNIMAAFSHFGDKLSFYSKLITRCSQLMVLWPKKIGQTFSMSVLNSEEINIKCTKIIFTIITHIIVVIIITWFCNTRKNVVFDVQKSCTTCPNWGEGGER